MTRLVTQMYFPGDPLIPLDPVLQSIPDVEAQRRLVSQFDLSLTEPEWALGFRFDIVLGGGAQRRLRRPEMRLIPTRVADGGAVFQFLRSPRIGTWAFWRARARRANASGSRFAWSTATGDPTPGDSMIELWQADARGGTRTRLILAQMRPIRISSGFGRLETDADGACVFETVKPGARSGRDAGAAHQRDGIRARAAEAFVHARVFRGRAGERAAIRCWRWCRRSGAPRCWRGRRPGTRTLVHRNPSPGR